MAQYDSYDPYNVTSIPGETYDPYIGRARRRLANYAAEIQGLKQIKPLNKQHQYELSRRMADLTKMAGEDQAYLDETEAIEKRYQADIARAQQMGARDRIRRSLQEDYLKKDSLERGQMTYGGVQFDQYGQPVQYGKQRPINESLDVINERILARELALQGQPPKVQVGTAAATAAVGTKAKWSSPREGIDADGNRVVYRVNQDGDIDIIEGIKPPSTSEGKVLTSSEVKQMSEFDAYQKTTDQIIKMVDAGSAKHTGPFEFIRKIRDNWGIMPNEERIKLRTLVARLPGLMYAMRGKQLSDKELEVAMDMMPKMKMDDVAFKVALDTFTDYMQLMLKGRIRAFKEAGYKVESVDEPALTVDERGDQLAREGKTEEEIIRILETELRQGAISR
jgi:hypothetical protein